METGNCLLVKPNPSRLSVMFSLALTSDSLMSSVSSPRSGNWIHQLSATASHFRESSCQKVWKKSVRRLSVIAGSLGDLTSRQELIPWVPELLNNAGF